MAEIVHVNGPAVLYVAKAGSTVARFGVTDEGMTLNFTTAYDPVMTDDNGTLIPYDFQYQGIMCSITGRMKRWEETIMEQLRTRLPSRAAGTLSVFDIGTLAFTSGQYWSLYIESSARTGLALESPWRFPAVLPTDAFSLTLGTKHSTAPVGFTAYPKDGVLYTRS